MFSTFIISNSLGSENSGGHSDVRVVKLEDLGWLHGYPIDNDKQQCKYCNKQMKSEGITRLTQHLAGRCSNVAKCKSCPFVVFAQMRELLKGTKAKKKWQEEKKRKGQQDSLQWRYF